MGSRRPRDPYELGFVLVVGAAVVVALLLLSSCTEITILYPICEVTTVDLEAGTITVDTLAQPDSACIAEFLEKTRR